MSLLREAPMHPYEMQRQMHLRHTDDLLALKRGSLYHAIYQLQRDGLIEPLQVSPRRPRPEGTVYRITPDGEDELVGWLRDLLSVSVREPSQFAAALAHVAHIDLHDALEQLQVRVRTLPEAERTWLSKLIEEIRAGELVARGQNQYLSK